MTVKSLLVGSAKRARGAARTCLIHKERRRRRTRRSSSQIKLYLRLETRKREGRAQLMLRALRHDLPTSSQHPGCAQSRNSSANLCPSHFTHGPGPVTTRPDLPTAPLPILSSSKRRSPPVLDPRQSQEATRDLKNAATSRISAGLVECCIPLR